MTVRLFNFVILHLLYDIFFVVVTICVFCHDGNKGFTYLLTYIIFYSENVAFFTAELGSDRTFAPG